MGRSLVFGVLAALLRITPLYDPDFFWHLHTGRYIATHRAIPWHDPFSHTAHGRPWRFVDALVDLGLYGLYTLGGFSAVIVTTALLGGLAVLLTLEAIRHTLARTSGGVYGLVAVAPCLLAGVVYRVTPRPQTVAIVLFAAMLWVVATLPKHPRRWWLLPALTALWQNAHPSGTLGVAIAFAALFGTVVDQRREGLAVEWRPMLPAVAATVPALFLTLHPVDRLMAGISHSVDPALARMISEWAPLWRFTNAPAVMGLGVLLLLSVGSGVAWRERRLPTVGLFVALGGSLLALRAVRFVPFAAMGLALPAAASVEAVLARWRWRWAPTAAVVAVVTATLPFVWQSSHGFGLGVRQHVFPEGASQFLATHTVRGNMLNGLEDGGWLLWTVGDRHPVFFDGRSWALYPADIITESLQLHIGQLAPVVERHDIGFAVLPVDNRIAWFELNGRWRVVYIDDDSMVAVRIAGNEALADTVGYRVAHFSRWREDMARWSRDPAMGARALAESERIVQAAPHAGYAWVMRAAALGAAGQNEAADEAAERAVSLRPDLLATHRARMVRCEVRHNRACLCDEARWLLARSARNPAAQTVVDREHCP